MALILVFIGGGLGASLRYLVTHIGNKHFALKHWATFVINIVGCLFLGFVATLAIKRPNIIHHDEMVFLTTGVAGGFTTFSTFSYENLNLLKNDKIAESLIYMLASLFCGILGIYLGYLLAA